MSAYRDMPRVEAPRATWWDVEAKAACEEQLERERLRAASQRRLDAAPLGATVFWSWTRTGERMALVYGPGPTLVDVVVWP